MAHLPGHNRPFTSFLTQGMQNTNQNLNTMGLPNDPIYYPKNPNPSELPMQQNFMGTGGPKPTDKFENPSNISIQPGFGSFGNFFNKPMPKGPSEIPMQQDFMDMGGPKPPDKIQNPSNIFMQQDFIGTGNIKPIEEPSLGNQIDFPNYLQEDPNYVAPPLGGGMQTNPNVDEQLNIVGQGFDVNNDGVVDFFDLYEAQSQQEYFGDDFATWLMNTQYEGEPGIEFANWWNSFSQEQQESFQSAWQNTLELVPSYEQNFLENLTGYIVGSPGVQAQQFTGGGGQGGQAARQLYFPGTSGGFAGVGSGIDSSMLQNLLNRG